MLRSDSQRKWEESRDTVPVSAGGQDQERAERSGGGRDDPHSRALQQVLPIVLMLLHLVQILG